MLKVRIEYTKKAEMKKAIETLKQEFDVLHITEEAKSNNPKYSSSLYKIAYADIQMRDE